MKSKHNLRIDWDVTNDRFNISQENFGSTSCNEGNYLKKHALKAKTNENKIQFLCKSDIINLCVLLNG